MSYRASSSNGEQTVKYLRFTRKTLMSLKIRTDAHARKMKVISAGTTFVRNMDLALWMLKNEEMVYRLHVFTRDRTTCISQLFGLGESGISFTRTTEYL